MKFSLGEFSTYGLKKEIFDACGDRIRAWHYLVFRVSVVASFFAFAIALLETEILGVLYDYGGAFIVYFFVTGLLFVFLIRRPETVAKHATAFYYILGIILISYPIVTSRFADWERMANFPVILAIVVLPLIDNTLRVAVLVAASDAAALVMMRVFLKHPTVIANDTMSILFFSILILIGNFFLHHFRLKEMYEASRLTETAEGLAAMAGQIREAEADVREVSAQMNVLLGQLEADAQQRETHTVREEEKEAARETAAAEEAVTAAEETVTEETVTEEPVTPEGMKEAARESVAEEETAEETVRESVEEEETAEEAARESVAEEETAEETAREETTQEVPVAGTKEDGVLILPWDEEDTDSWEAIPLSADTAEDLGLLDPELEMNIQKEPDSEDAVPEMFVDASLPEEGDEEERTEEEQPEEAPVTAPSEDDMILGTTVSDFFRKMTEELLSDGKEEAKTPEEEDAFEEIPEEEVAEEEEDVFPEEEEEEDIFPEEEEEVFEGTVTAPAYPARAMGTAAPAAPPAAQPVSAAHVSVPAAPAPAPAPAPAAPPVMPAMPLSADEKRVITKEELDEAYAQILADARDGDIASVRARLKALNDGFAIPGIYRMKVMQLDGMVRGGNLEGVKSLLGGGAS